MQTLLGLKTLPFLKSPKPTNPFWLLAPKMLPLTETVEACILSGQNFQYPENQNT
jgi:hypothetical protein